ncbi:MAG TPA: transglutaminase domain-containing protein [Tepidisphaeraceae bacterium]|nr:transglutaminase domain-containing protein [Tepidisphaeraceae bacterium]
MSLSISAVAAELPPGASWAFVSRDPLVRTAVEHYTAGHLSAALKLLEGKSVQDIAARDELIEVIRRYRREYSQTRPQLLSALRKSIPDITDADLDRWIAAGQVQCREIDGEVLFFRREPGQILRFCKEAMERKAAATKPAPDTDTDASSKRWTRLAHLAEIIAAANASDAQEVLPTRTRVNYSLTVKPNARAKTGSRLRVWLPFPQDYARQSNVRLLNSEPGEARVAESASDGQTIAGPAQRTVYLEQTIDNPALPIRFAIEFEYDTSALYPTLDDATAAEALRGSGVGVHANYLAERPPHIVFTPELKARVDEIVGRETNPLAKARKIFHWLDEHLPWTPEEEYCVIPNLSMHGLQRGKGDCGVASMLFITMCRIAGVPARWQSGWTTHPVGWNMHDWAEIHVAPWGWIPVDASYGRQKSDDPAIRDFYFGHTDSHRLIVNLDYGHPLSPLKKSFRSEPLDFQRGEVELDGHNLYFDEWDYQFAFEHTPIKR